MDIARLSLISSMQYKPPVVQTTGLSSSQRIESLQQSFKIDTQNQYGSGSIDETNIPVAREQRIYGLNPFVKPKLDPLKQAELAIKEKYGTANISFTSREGMKENYLNGLSPMPFGALGNNAINGNIGGQLNIKA